MSATAVETPRLRLVLREPAEVLAWVDSLPSEVRAEVSPDWIARVRAATAPDPWTCGFVMVRREDGAPVGSCAYKAPPDANGMVEIAYGVDVEHQGRGYATEAARALTEFAFDAREVRVVRAHTLPEANASSRVLTKCGFEFLGEAIDPEDGLVWRWETRR